MFSEKDPDTAVYANKDTTGGSATTMRCERCQVFFGRAHISIKIELTALWGAVGGGGGGEGFYTRASRA